MPDMLIAAAPRFAATTAGMPLPRNTLAKPGVHEYLLSHCLTWAMWLTAVLRAEGCMLFHSCTRRLDLLLTSFARPSNTPLHSLLHHWSVWQGPPARVHMHQPECRDWSCSSMLLGRGDLCSSMALRIAGGIQYRQATAFLAWPQVLGALCGCPAGRSWQRPPCAPAELGPCEPLSFLPQPGRVPAPSGAGARLVSKKKKIK